MRTITRDQFVARLVGGDTLERREGHVCVRHRDERVPAALLETFAARAWIEEVDRGEWAVTETGRAELSAEAASGRLMPTDRACRWLLEGGRIRLTAPHGCRIQCYTYRPGLASSPAPRERVSMSLFFELERRGWLRGLPGGQEFEAGDAGRAALDRAVTVWAPPAAAAEDVTDEGAPDGWTDAGEVCDRGDPAGDLATAADEPAERQPAADW
jgi:hypothetical protein